MRIARLARGKAETFGLVRGGAVATREEITYETGVPIPAGVKDFLFDGWLGEVRGRLGGLAYSEALSGFRTLAPIGNPPKILCLAFNYRDHAGEQGREPPDEPVAVMKPRTALCGGGDEIVVPPFVGRPDYEAELALVIGRDCRDITPEEAGAAVFGYTILNDVSARDVQARDGQFTRAKGFDTFAPCGPWITTADEVPRPDRLRITTRVNGEVRQDSSTSMMHVKPHDAVSRLSQHMTLERGDIISTGTPAGVALGGGGRFLEDGDVVEAEIEGLGVLRNTVRRSAAS